MVTQTADIKKMIAGDMQIYYGDVASGEPLLGVPIIAGVEEEHAGTVAIGTLTRGAGHDLFEGSAAAVGGVAADLLIDNSTDNATKDLTISDITWDPSGYTSPLQIEATLPAASTTGGFGKETEANGTLIGKSVYFQHNGETAEIPIVLQTAGGLVSTVVFYGTDLITRMDFYIPNTSEYAQIRKVLDGIQASDTYTFRIANAGGVEGVMGSNPGWKLLGDSLIAEDGIASSFQQTTEPQRILRETVPVAYYRTAEEFMITATLLDYTAETQAFLLNQRTVTSVDATADRVGYVTTTMERGPTVLYNSLVVRMPSPHMLNGQAQLYFPKMFVSSDIEYTLSKTPSGYPVTFSIVRDETHGFAARFTAQTAPKTS